MIRVVRRGTEEEDESGQSCEFDVRRRNLCAVAEDMTRKEEQETG